MPRWTKNGKPVTPAIVFGLVLAVNKVTFGDNGTYACHGTADKAGKIKFTANSKLLVAGKTRTYKWWE